MKKPSKPSKIKYIEVDEIIPRQFGEYRYIDIGIDPKPTPRPRVSRFGTYYPKDYKEYKSILEDFASKIKDVVVSDKLFSVRIDFIMRKPNKTIKVRPSGDLDNLSKGIIDSLTGTIWNDDDQIVSLFTRKFWETDMRKDVGFIRIMFKEVENDEYISYDI